MSQITIKKKESSYSVIPNEILQRPDMTMKAKGLMCYLLSLPDDWRLYKSELCKHFKDGKDGIYSAFEELVEFGYVEQQEREKKKGKFDGYDYTVFDTPWRENRGGKTVSGKPATENPPLINTNKESTNKQITNKSNDDAEKSATSVYFLVLDFWLKEAHPGWTMDGMQGKHLKQIITKIKSSLTTAKKPVTDESVVSTFKYIIKHLPKFYENKDLAIINSKYNEIIEEIKQPKQSNDPNRVVYTPPPPSNDAKFTDPAYKLNYPDAK